MRPSEARHEAVARANGFTDRQLLACAPNLRRYARALCRGPEQVDDLVQSVLLRALAKRHLFVDRGRGSLVKWLNSLTYNIFINTVRRAARSPLDAAAPEPDDRLYQHSVRGQQEDRVKFNEMRRELAKMSAEQRNAIVLVGGEGMGYDEAADVLGIPVGTLRSRLSRGREALARACDR